MLSGIEIFKLFVSDHLKTLLLCHFKLFSAMGGGSLALFPESTVRII